MFMKIINIFIIVAVYVSFVLLCIAYDIAFSESTIDWIFLEIILGFYLYLGYLIFGIIFGRPKNQIQYL